GERAIHRPLSSTSAHDPLRTRLAAARPRRGLLIALRPVEASVAERLHLWLQLDAEALQHALAACGHHRERVGRARGAGVLDEVRVLRREARAADRQAITAGLGEQQAGGAAFRARVIRVLERRAERLDALRLCLVPALSQLCERRRDYGWIQVLERKRHLCDDLAGRDRRAARGEPALLRRALLDPTRRDDPHPLERPRQLAAVRA